MKNSERMRCIYACDLWVSPFTDQQELKKTTLNLFKLFYFFTFLCMCKWMKCVFIYVVCELCFSVEELFLETRSLYVHMFCFYVQPSGMVHQR